MNVAHQSNQMTPSVSRRVLRSLFIRVRRHLQAILQIDMQQEKLEALQTKLDTLWDGSRDPSITYISNGLINVDSYLDLAMQNVNKEFIEFKSEYREDGWYFLFEKLFRGTEEEISGRQAIYIDYLRTCYATLTDKNPQGYFLDFGSGRGEFLSLLAKANMPGRGIDTSHLNIEYVTNKGLDVACEDGIDYLRGVKDNSLYGITSYQVAEHLEFDVLKDFIGIAYKKIMPGGIIIIETVNPSCIRAMQYFYIDPTHVRPYPPELLRFQAEWEGFVTIKILFYMPAYERNPKDDQTNYIGYALIGYKPDEQNVNV